MVDLASIVVTVVAVADIAVFAYGAYWASEIRRALASPLYRRQGLWVEAIGVYFVVFFLLVVIARALGAGPLSETSGLGVAAVAFVYVGVVMFFVWIDSSVKLARRSDPLRRDTLKWSVLRWLLGFGVIVGSLFAIVFNSAQALDFSRATPLYGPIGATLLLGAIALYLSGKRSRDLVLRRHLVWFGLFAAFLWVTSAVVGSSYWRSLRGDAWVDLVSYTFFAVSACFLYKSARSLAPVSPLPLIVSADPSPEPAPNPPIP